MKQTHFIVRYTLHFTFDFSMIFQWSMIKILIFVPLVNSLLSYKSILCCFLPPVKKMSLVIRKASNQLFLWVELHTNLFMKTFKSEKPWQKIFFIDLWHHFLLNVVVFLLKSLIVELFCVLHMMNFHLIILGLKSEIPLIKQC